MFLFRQFLSRSSTITKFWQPCVFNLFVNTKLCRILKSQMMDESSRSNDSLSLPRPLPVFTSAEMFSSPPNLSVELNYEWVNECVHDVDDCILNSNELWEVALINVFCQQKCTQLNFIIVAIRKWLTWTNQCDAVHSSIANEFPNTPSRTSTFRRLRPSVGFWESQSWKLKIKLMMKSCQSHKTMRIRRQTTTIWAVELLRHPSYHSHRKTTLVELHRARSSQGGQWERTKKMTSCWRNWWVWQDLICWRFS